MTKIHAELAILPIGTPTPSLGTYIAQGLKGLDRIDGIRFQTTPMGTMIEAEKIEKIFEAAKVVSDLIFAMGISRVETILKIDERRDKDRSLEDKLRSIGKNQ
ncbi:MAG TPA: MTH1187 family thiamine-binding protein [Candidatus Nitrosotalea sp.]|nr:MTH1187 family thiamine-binding protein [Candidatus Nitrosotalea sp.]